MIAHGGNVALVPGHRIRNHRPLEGIDLFGKRRYFRRHLPEQVEAGTMHAEHEAVGDVAQLPDIARPRISHQLPPLFVRQHGRVAIVPRGGLQHEVLEENRDVLAPVA